MIAAAAAAPLVVGRISVADAEPTSSSTPVAKRNTASVERRDITATTSFDGTVDYREHRTLSVPPGSEVAQRTITDVVDLGNEVDEGAVVYELDGHPTVVIQGDVPMHRALSERSADGPDVRQLERFLVGAGFDPDGELTVDEEFTWKTAELVEAWEETIGVEPDGVVDQWQVVFLPGPAIVTDVLASVGQSVAVGGPLLEMALPDSGRVFDALVPLSEQEDLEPGTDVTVHVAGADVRGTIESVLPATVVGSAAGPDAEPMAIIRASLGPVDIPQVTATADMSVTETLAGGVLVVPVAALVTLAEGGYAVELLTETGTRLVGVTPGHFGDGVVEIEGESIDEGAEVVVP